MSYLQLTTMTTPEAGTVESNDLLYSTLKEHIDANKNARTRVIMISENAEGDRAVVSDIRLDYEKQEQIIDTYHQHGTSKAENLYARMNATFTELNGLQESVLEATDFGKKQGE